MLDLPIECGLDVNWTVADPRYGPAIGYTNIGGDVVPAMFAALLNRTDRSLVSGATVLLDRGCEQHVLPSCHVLISNILLCGSGNRLYEEPAASSVRLARLFIASANPDGSGTDLTGGMPRFEGVTDDRVSRQGPWPHELWPDRVFGGALALVDRLCQWWSKKAETDGALALARLELIKTFLVPALRAVRTYRSAIRPTLAEPMMTAGIHTGELHELIASYLVVPLCDPSQLKHPLLRHPPASAHQIDPTTTTL
jgi:hypothetical protein